MIRVLITVLLLYNCMGNIQTKQIEQTTEQLSFSEASFQNEIFEKERKQSISLSL